MTATAGEDPRFREAAELLDAGVEESAYAAAVLLVARGEPEDGIRRLFHDVGKRLAVPVRYGFPAGHDGKNIPLPFGVRARIDAKGRLFLLDSLVEAG